MGAEVPSFRLAVIRPVEPNIPGRCRWIRYLGTPPSYCREQPRISIAAGRCLRIFHVDQEREVEISQVGLRGFSSDCRKLNQPCHAHARA